MDEAGLRIAKIEAERFLGRVRNYQKSTHDADTPSSERAAMLRSSLDLTKALARLRRSE